MLIACFTFNFALKIVAMPRHAATTIRLSTVRGGRRRAEAGGGGSRVYTLLQNLFPPWVSFLALDSIDKFYRFLAVGF